MFAAQLSKGARSSCASRSSEGDVDPLTVDAVVLKPSGISVGEPTIVVELWGHPS